MAAGVASPPLTAGRVSCPGPRLARGLFHSHRAAGHRLIPGPAVRFPPEVAGGPGSSLLELPGASASGVFSPLSGGRPPTVAHVVPCEAQALPGAEWDGFPSAVAFAVSRLRCRLSGRYGGDVVVEPDTPHAEGVGTSGRREPQYTLPALNPKAKEPFAILSCQGVPVMGGSSRRPVSRVTGPSCSGETAEEAHEGRSGWKPRAFQPSGNSGVLPLSGCAPFGSPHRLRAGSARLAAWAGRIQSAATRVHTPRKAVAQRLAMRACGLLSVVRIHPACAALDPSGAVAGSPRPRPGANVRTARALPVMVLHPTRPRTRKVRATARKAGGGV